MKRSFLFDRFYTAVATSSWFLIVYNFTNWVSSKRSNLGVAAFSWEVDYIPLVPIFIIPYWSIDLFFLLAPFFLKKQEDLKTYRQRIFTAIGLAGIFFLLFPLELQFNRPKVEGLLGVMLAALDNFNNFWNLAPSLHIALRTILWTVFIPLCRGITQNLLRFWFICVGLSTLLCWQHHLIDVFTGQLLGLFVIQIIPLGILANREAPTARHKQLALRYLCGACIWVLICILLWPIGFVLLWPAVSFLLVSLAYFCNDTRILGKFSGKLNNSAWWIFLPYRLLARAWQQKYLQGKNRSVVSSDLSFGALPDKNQLAYISAPAILDLTAEYPAPPELITRKYRNVPMLDLVCPSAHQLAEAVHTIEELRSFGEVYVHCALGVGRSALVIAAWFLYTGKSADSQSAIASVTACCKNAIFRDQELLVLENFIQRQIDKNPICR